MLSFKEILQEGVYDPTIFKGIFLAGGPGSGKSYVAHNTTGGHGFKMVNSDDIFEKMLKDKGLKTTPEDIYSDKGQKIRLKAKALLKKKKQMYINGRLGLIIDGTGKDYEKIKKQSERLRDVGYDTMMIFVNTSLEVALQRNEKRKRTLPMEQVIEMWKGVQKNIGHFQSYFKSNNFLIVDNNDAGEDVLSKVWKKVMKLAKQKPQNKIAAQWIKQQKDLKKR